MTVRHTHAHKAHGGYSAGRHKVHYDRIPGGKKLRCDAAVQYKRMYAAAKRAGINLRCVSGYRSYAEQARLYRLYRSGRGNLAARPGRSNHQKGIAVDIAVGGTTRSRTYRWLAKHAHEFGFKRTVRSEPWHWEFRRR